MMSPSLPNVIEVLQEGATRMSLVANLWGEVNKSTQTTRGGLKIEEFVM